MTFDVAEADRPLIADFDGDVPIGIKHEADG